MKPIRRRIATSSRYQTIAHRLFIGCLIQRGQPVGIRVDIGAQLVRCHFAKGGAINWKYVLSRYKTGLS